MLFGRLKSAKKYLPRNQELDAQIDQTIGVFRPYEIATTSPTIRGSWGKAGFGLVRRNDTCYLWAHEDNIWRSPEFQEIWQLDYLDVWLSQRKRQ
jgi:hypothetical protein